MQRALQKTHETTRETSGGPAARCEATARPRAPSTPAALASGTGADSEYASRRQDASTGLMHRIQFDVRSCHVAPRGTSSPRRRSSGWPPTPALAAAGRARRQRLPGSRAGGTGRPAAEPGLLPPAAAARRRTGHRHAQQLRRPRQLLPPGSGPLRGCADRQRGRAAPGAAPARDTADPAGRTAAVPAHRRAVRVHRQQRPLHRSPKPCCATAPPTT